MEILGVNGRFLQPGGSSGPAGPEVEAAPRPALGENRPGRTCPGGGGGDGRPTIDLCSSRSPAATRCAVEAATPAAAAAWRTVVAFPLESASATASCPGVGSRGRRRPSRPVLAVRSAASVARRRRATVECESPHTSPTQRSLRAGQRRSSPAAAAWRSTRLRGLPCLTLAWTAMTRAPVSSPEYTTALISVRPARRKASARCKPSITVIVASLTMIGGSRSSTSISRATWSSSTLTSRAEYPTVKSASATVRTSDRSGASCRRGAPSPAAAVVPTRV